MSAGILEFGFTPTNPLPNWLPSPIRMSQASYSAVTGGQQFLQHDCNLDAIGRPERIELQRMLSARQLLFMRRTRDRAIDIGIAPVGSVVLLPDPDVWRRGFRGLGPVR